MKKPNRVIQIIYLVLGTIFLIIGAIGIALPILPTVPFFLLTSYFYAKGSKKFHDWFVHSKIYTRYVSGLAEHRTMSINGELTLLLFVSLMLGTVTISFADTLVVSIILPLIDLMKWIYFIFRIKTISRSELLTLKSTLADEKEKIGGQI